MIEIKEKPIKLLEELIFLCDETKQKAYSLRNPIGWESKYPEMTNLEDKVSKVRNKINDLCELDIEFTAKIIEENLLSSYDKLMVIFKSYGTSFSGHICGNFERDTQSAITLHVINQLDCIKSEAKEHLCKLDPETYKKEASYCILF